jgi:hypothetical protein
VVAAVRAQIEGGSTYFMVTEPIIQLAEEICRALPCAEQVRFTSTGSEATFFALRTARTARQRDKILKFEGGYHGAHDYSMMSSTPRSPKAFPAPVPDSSGIPHAIEADVLIAPYNDLATVEGIVDTHADELAAVIIEPFQRLIPPQPGFLEGLREITRRHGILLIFDEVVTGFRLAYGGAQQYYGVVPDIACVGKIVGGGFPLAAVCASEELMRPFDPQQDGKGDFISQSGTLNGKPHRGRGRPRHPGRAAQARRLRDHPRHGQAPHGRPPRAGRAFGAARPGGGRAGGLRHHLQRRAHHRLPLAPEGRRRPRPRLHHRADQARGGEEHAEDVRIPRALRGGRGAHPRGVRGRAEDAAQEKTRPG